MYTRTTACALGFVLVSGAVRADGSDIGRVRALLSAIRKVETGSAPNGGRDAVGDAGRSLGPYQIQRPYWTDSRVGGRYQGVRNARFAERVMIAYWRRYCPDALARGDWQTLARVHNGGPRGHLTTATRRYWQKVQRVLSAR